MRQRSEPGGTTHSSEVSLISPWPPEECVRRIQAGISNEWSGWADGPNRLAARPLAGRVTSRRLSLHKRSTSRNSFTPCFLATVHPQEGGGTLITGYFAMHPSVTVFISLLSALPACVGVVLLVMGVRALLRGDGGFGLLMLLTVFVPFVLTMAGVAFAKAKLSPETGEAVFMREYLLEQLDAVQPTKPLPPQFAPWSPPAQ